MNVNFKIRSQRISPKGLVTFFCLIGSLYQMSLWLLKVQHVLSLSCPPTLVCDILAYPYTNERCCHTLYHTVPVGDGPCCENICY